MKKFIDQLFHVMCLKDSRNLARHETSLRTYFSASVVITATSGDNSSIIIHLSYQPPR